MKTECTGSGHLTVRKSYGQPLSAFALDSRNAAGQIGGVAFYAEGLVALGVTACLASTKKDFYLRREELSRHSIVDWRGDGPATRRASAVLLRWTCGCCTTGEWHDR